MNDKILVDRKLFQELRDFIETHYMFSPILFSKLAERIKSVLDNSQSETVVDKAQEPEFCECERPQYTHPFVAVDTVSYAAYCVRCNKAEPKPEKISLEECVNTQVVVTYKKNDLCIFCDKHIDDHLMLVTKNVEIEAEAERLYNIYVDTVRKRGRLAPSWFVLPDSDKKDWQAIAKDVLERQKAKPQSPP